MTVKKIPAHQETAVRVSKTLAEMRMPPGMQSVSAVPSVTPASEIAIAMHQLDSGLTGVEERLAELVERLAPVLHMTPGSKLGEPVDSSEPKEEPQSPLGKELDRYFRRLVISTRVLEAIQRDLRL